MSTSRTAALGVVADIIETHHDHVWGRLPFLGPMAARIDRERGHGGRLTDLIGRLHDVLFDHLDREDRVLLAIACDHATPDVGPRAARLHDEHVVVIALLDELRAEVGGDFRAPNASGPTARLLCAELASLEQHLRAQIELEEAVLGAHLETPETHRPMHSP